MCTLMCNLWYSSCAHLHNYFPTDSLQRGFQPLQMCSLAVLQNPNCTSLDVDDAVNRVKVGQNREGRDSGVSREWEKPRRKPWTICKVCGCSTYNSLKADALRRLRGRPRTVHHELCENVTQEVCPVTRLSSSKSLTCQVMTQNWKMSRWQQLGITHVNLNIHFYWICSLNGELKILL